ncbi:MAG: Cna B-type domain-containing protein, partial [Clostridiales bacterium]|nr:Cna B-type domain-containing protein [Clostridiales bacterium]
TDDAAGAATDDAAGAATDDAAGAATDDAAGATTDDAAGATTDDAAGAATDDAAGAAGSLTGTLNFNDANPNADTAETKVSVSWSCTTEGGFKEGTTGVYTFTAALNEIAEDYTYVGDAAGLPAVTVTVNGPDGNVALIKETDVEYPTLDEAVTAAEDGYTIVVLRSCPTNNGLNLSKNLTIQGEEGVNPTIYFVKYGIALWGKALTFKDCKVVMNDIGSTPYTAEWNWMTICANKNASLTLNNVEMTLDGENAGNKHAIYFCYNNTLNLTESTLTIKNYQQDALEWDGGNGGYNVNITDSTFISDHNRSGFTGTFYATIDNSTVEVINSRGNGSNGTYYTIKNGSNVLFDGNRNWGISAWRIDMTGKSTLTATNNGYSGVWTRVLNVDSTCTLDVEKNGNNALGFTTNAGIFYQGNGTYTSTLEKGATVTIKDNAGSGIYTAQGVCNMTIGSATITGNGIGAINVQNQKGATYGGGIYNVGTMVLDPEGVILYNNHADTAGDDICNNNISYYNTATNPSITFAEVGSDWTLDGVPDHCNDAIDGWYDDSVDNRWEAHTAPRHIIQYTDFTEGLATVEGLLALKAAHGIVIPELPSNAETQAPTVAKVATEMTTDTKQTDVTLEVNGSESRDSIAVMFLLDKSTSQGTARQNAAQMLQTLKSKTNTNILYDVVIFSGSASSTGWCDIKDDAALENTLENFANKETTGGTNLLAGIYQAQEDLEELPEAYQDCAYLVTISDGITYVWDNSTISNSGVVSKSGDGEVMSMVADQIADGGQNHHVNNTMTTWDILHGLGVSVSDVYGSYASFLKAVPTKLANTEKYLIPYGTDATTAENVLPVYTDNMAAAEADYACGAEFAMYYSTYAYADLAQSFARVFTLPMPEISNGTERSDWDNYPCGKEMMLYLQNAFSTNATQGAVHDADSEEIFSEIGDQILYSIQSGTVTDVIGSNFDLADVNSFMLTIGGEVNKENGQLTGGTQVTAKTVEGNTVTFGDGEYVVTYYPATENEAEHFVWAINTPVTSAGSLHLTYTLVLAGTFDDGTYGEYDADGSERYENLLTNESAKLEYTSTADGSKGSINFPKPTVQYKQESSGENPGSSTGGSKMRVTATKVWSGDDDADRPSSVKVQLLKDGKEYATATLKASNNWTYKWTDLSKNYTWTVKEVDVPNGYTDSYNSVMKDDVKTITVTNTYKVEEITDPETPTTDLPDTDVPTSGDTGTDLQNPDVPRADAPKTGDATWLWAMAAAVSGMGLVWLTISGKKRKEEDA